MYGSPTGVWGKLEQDDAGLVAQWHPLAAHCADVAACCEALLRHTLLRKRLANTGGLDDLDAVQCARLCVAAVLHDMGKPNMGFQRKALPRGSAGPVAGHVREVVLLFDAFSDSRAGRALLTALPAREWDSWGDAYLQLLVASICHHGRPVRSDDTDGFPSGLDGLWMPEGGNDPIEAVRELVACARRWFPDAWGEGRAPLPSAPEFQHAFSGLMMLADWLGSDRATFPFAETLDDRMPFARSAAREALAAMHLDTSAARSALGTEPFDFEALFSYRPRAAQQAVLSLPVDRDGSLVVLEAETGSGKTEAALSYFFRLFREGRVDGMYFALPTRTAATQIHTRVAAALARAFPDGSCRPPTVLAVPGYLRVDDSEGRRLPPFEVLWSDDPAGRFHHRAWAAENPKRYLASAVAVGTIDQVLLSVLRVNHAHLRGTSLLRQLLVVDEVHASDTYMGRLLEEVLRRHLRAGGHVLLMSATLGQALRSRLLATVPKGPRGAIPSLRESETAPYPAVRRVVSGGVLDVPVAAGAEQKRVSYEVARIAGDAEEIARRALGAAVEGARVLVLRNTVTDCVATQAALEALAAREGQGARLFRCAEVPAPHHARYAGEDRRALDEAIEGAFGKKSTRNGVVVVATQTVQQSLDLDADLLLTDLCPMDVLLQRIGRVHRHGAARPRPAGFHQARVVVLTPAERDLGALFWKDGSARGDHGMGVVYEDLRVLEATWRQVESPGVWEIPRDNRVLVERTTHPEALAEIVRSLAGGWARHETYLLGTQGAQGRLAEINAFDRTVEFGEACFADLTNDEHIKTRLGQGDRRAVFSETVTSPFGRAVRELSIPAWMARGVPEENEPPPAWVSRGEGEGVFGWGEARFVYDRLGLRREAKAEAVEVEA